MSPTVWAARGERATYLLRETPHAEELLVFYIRLTKIQAGVAGKVPSAAWAQALAAQGGAPALRPEGLPREAMLDLLDTFLGDVTEVGTDVIAEGARALLDTDAAGRMAALTGAVGFHARAFLEAVWTTLAPTLDRGGEHGGGSHCPACGSLPVAAVLQDLPEALGARSLLCPLCGIGWRIDRLRCAACGETSADRIELHEAESVPWVRLDECLTCRRYLKTIDLRRRGDAVPVVDELATIELDLWARDRGLTKVRTNVLEL